ncbi:RhoGAP-domain-containing protein [Daedalea quercina L-15889]|uniref:RhoGAP-domain-containing protein n=1 Tax=Daedalea quercina L-15889 TaxID=1314783 RepID=A0A165MDQ0_9APHY|nr:RhoGAP-domain-containing protein [Daedalea quercina L-15889]
MSSSQESQLSGRPSTSEPPQQDAITLFDLHLKFLTDSYLTFFVERYVCVEALLRLHRKVKAVDTVLDDPGRGELSTTRAAWSEIRDNVAREADTRVAFLGALTADVINPLATLRETQDRIRKRIKEDLKDAVNTHTDYSENVLPRLKRTYLRKCQEAEEYKAAIQLNNQPPMSPSDGQFTTAGAKPNPGLSARPAIITAPQPLRPLDRRPSVGAVSNHARSPSTSTSTALQDLAHQGKRQLNQLMTLLDKGGNMKDLAGRSDNALKSVRAKREADEADKEYRKGVHWLETLRLRRVKILESGYNSLEAFVRENAETVKSVLQQYTDNMIATCATQSQICEHGRRSVARISPGRDSSTVGYNIPRLLAAAIPRPVYYYNYTVGECKDLIFGVSLVDYATARNLHGVEGEQGVPKIVRICVRDIEKRGIECEGIYRVSGKHASVRELQHKIERNEAAFQFNPAVDDVYAVASFLKMYLRELPEPLFRFPLQERLAHSEDFDEHRGNDFQLIRGKIRRLPSVHQATLKVLLEHLARIAAHAEKNKMDAKNLAIVFAAVIFGEDEMPKSGGDLLTVHSWKDTLCEDLINHAHILFQPTGSPQLLTVAPAIPTTPSPISPSASGSPRARATSQASTLGPMGPPTAPPEDFRPQLPPRPQGSIHPSQRSAGLPLPTPLLPMSQRPNRQSLPVQPRTQMPDSPPSPGLSRSREVSKERRTLKTTPRLQQRELELEEPTSPKRDWLLSPRLPPRPLSPAVSTRTGESSIQEEREEPEGRERLPLAPWGSNLELHEPEDRTASTSTSPSSSPSNIRPESRQSATRSVSGSSVGPQKSPAVTQQTLPDPQGSAPQSTEGNATTGETHPAG